MQCPQQLVLYCGLVGSRRWSPGGTDTAQESLLSILLSITKYQDVYVCVFHHPGRHAQPPDPEMVEPHKQELKPVKGTPKEILSPSKLLVSDGCHSGQTRGGRG